MLTLAVQNADVLRAIPPDGAGDDVRAFARTIGKDPSNLVKTVAALRREGLVEADAIALTGRAISLLPRLDVLEGLREAAAEGVVTLTHRELRASPLNPRRDFDSEEATAALEALRQSILTHGLQQNLVVQADADADGVRAIVAGESRWRAIGEAIEDGDLPQGFPIPCRLEHLSDEQHEELALIENMVRRDLHPLDEAQAFKRWRERRPTSEIAATIGRTPRHIQERMKLLELEEGDQARMRLSKDDPKHLTVSGARLIVQEHREPETFGRELRGLVEQYGTAAAKPAPPAASAQRDIEEIAPPATQPSRSATAALPTSQEWRPGKKAVCMMVELASKALRGGEPLGGYVACGEHHPDATGLANALVMEVHGGFLSGGGEGAKAMLGGGGVTYLREHDLLPTSDTVDALLDVVRLEAWPVKAVQEATQMGRWLTPWLNEDHVADPGRAQREAESASRRAELVAAGERAQQLEQDIRAFAEGAALLSVGGRQHALRELFARADTPTPWRASHAEDDDEVGPHLVADDSEIDLYGSGALEKLLVLAVAMATGEPPESWASRLPQPVYEDA